MHLVNFSELIEDVAEEVGWDAELLSPQEWTSIRRALNNALRDFWRAYWWPETMEQRVVYYAEAFVGNKTYLAGVMCYEGLSNSYFQAVRDVNISTWPPDYPNYWAKRTADETAPAFYDIAKAYVLTDRVRYGGFDFYCFADAPAGIQPTDNQHWGKLEPFETIIPYVALARPVIGRARHVDSGDGVQYELSAGPQGILVQDGGRVPTPTLVYQIRPPQITGDHFDASQAYTQERPDRAIYGLMS